MKSHSKEIKALPIYLQPKILSAVNILATTSKGIVVSNTDILNHLASLKNKTQTREQKIALRRAYDQNQAQK